MEKGLEVFYWFGAPTRIAGSVLGLTSIISKEARVPLGFQQFGTKKGGHKVSRVKVNDTSLTEYLESIIDDNDNCNVKSNDNNIGKGDEELRGAMVC